MNERLITEEQALQVAIALVSGEREKQDYGFSVLKESKEILEGKLFTLQEEKAIKKKASARLVYQGAAHARSLR